MMLLKRSTLGLISVKSVAMKLKSSHLRSFSNTQVNWDYDVIVSGGGIVGLATIAKLIKYVKGGLRIALIDPKIRPNAPIVEQDHQPDVRVYALSPSSIELLKEVGAWKHLDGRSKSYKKMQIWETESDGFVSFQTPESYGGELGRIVEDQAVQSAIYKAIIDSDVKVDFFYGHTICSLNNPPSNSSFFNGPVRIGIKNKDDPKNTISLNSRLIIGADGSSSAVRNLAGIPTWGWSYGQQAIVATVKVAYDHDTAWQVYLPTGPLALLPLWGNLSSIVWSNPTPIAKRLLSLSPEDFLRELNDALAKTPQDNPIRSIFSGKYSASQESSDPDSFEYGLGPKWLPAPIRLIRKEVVSLVDTVKNVSKLMEGDFQSPPSITAIESSRLPFPLQLQQASTYMKPRVVLVGDAAHSIHPQAGQGLNLGLNDVNALVNTILKGVNSGMDIGNELLLGEYNNRQRVLNSSMLLSVDMIDRIFKSNNQPVKFLRSMGMLGIHGNPFIKDFINDFASGQFSKI